MRILETIIGVTALCFSFANTASATVIDTTPSANWQIYEFGESDTTTYGQTFRTPNASETMLNSFSFFLDHTSGSAQSFRAYVMAWDEALGQTAGSVLFTSAVQTLPVDAGSNFIEFAIATGGVSLDEGQDYVAFFSVAGLFDSNLDKSVWQSISGSDPYTDGHFVFHNSNGVFPNPGTTWDCGTGCSWEGPGSDLSFKMSFSEAAVVPEPGSIALIGLGLAGLYGTRRRRT